MVKNKKQKWVYCLYLHMLVNIAHLVELNMLGPIFSKKLSDIILSFNFDGKP